MAFEPVQFVFHPPPTIPLTPASLAAPGFANNTTALGPAGLPVAGTTARQLMARLQDLSDTAGYLAGIIQERTASIAIAVDPSLDPEVAQALGRIYAGDRPPGISVAMYANLVKAEMAMMRADMSLATAKIPSKYQVSPLARGDVQTVINHFESTLVDRGDFLSQLPPLIRGVLGEQVAFDSLKIALSKYPGADGRLPAPAAGQPPSLNQLGMTSPVAASSSTQLSQTIQASLADPADATADVNPSLAANMNQRADVWQTYYAKTYDLTAGIDSVYADIQSINNAFITQPLNLLFKLVAMLTTLIALFHKTSLSSIRQSLVMMIIPRLMSEVGAFATVLDRLIQKAVNPALQVINSLGSLCSEIARDMNQVAWIVDGGLTGAIRSQVAGKNQVPTPPPSQLAAINALPVSLKQVTAGVAWAVNQTRTQSTLMQRSMFRIMDRCLGGSGDRLETLQSLRALTALITICNSIISQLNTMTSGGLGQQPSQTGSQIGALVNSVNSTGQQAIALSGDNIILSQPSLTPAPANVQTLLAAGGSTQINAASYLTVPVNPLSS